MKLTILLIVLSFCFFAQARSYKLEDINRYIPISKGQMDQEIKRDFLEQLKKDTSLDFNKLAKKYEQFKENWKNKMIEYLIQQLEINEEDAKEARKNPNDFQINYETYKLFLPFK